MSEMSETDIRMKIINGVKRVLVSYEKAELLAGQLAAAYDYENCRAKNELMHARYDVCCAKMECAMELQDVKPSTAQLETLLAATAKVSQLEGYVAFVSKELAEKEELYLEKTALTYEAAFQLKCEEEALKRCVSAAASDQ